MTRQLEHVNAGTPFGKWFRANLRDSKTGLSIIDIDTIVYYFHEYKQKSIMLIEEKANGDVLHTSQRLSFPILSTIISIGCKAMGVRWLGFHTIRMDGTTPDNSQWTELDGRRITKEQLVKFLNLEN